MSQYPIESESGLYEAINYLASGPAGLGQDFQGFNSYTTGYLTGNYRRPYTQTTPAALYVAPIALSTSEMLDGNTWKFTFASVQPSAPFAQGNNIYVSGVTSTPAGYYDGTYGIIGVVACTTTYVICRTVDSYTVIGSGTGGTAEYFNTGYRLSTDCNARVTVTGAQDRVPLSAQLTNLVSYTASTSSDMDYIVQINRYKGYLNNDPVNPDYLFGFDKTITQRTYSFTGLTGTASLPEIETIFSTVIDVPTPGETWPGYYWYILEVEFDVTNGGDLQVTENQFGLRSLSAQVVKP